jgi:hypothetical protein
VRRPPAIAVPQKGGRRQTLFGIAPPTSVRSRRRRLPPWTHTRSPCVRGRRWAHAESYRYAPDPERSLLRVLMLPDAKDGPSGSLQHGIGLPIARAVAVELRAPEIAVERWAGRVHWAAVPEAAVNEHRELQPRKYEVGGPSEARHGSRGHPEAETKFVGSRSNCQLRRGIPWPVSNHRTPDGRGRCPRAWWRRPWLLGRGSQLATTAHPHMMPPNGAPLLCLRVTSTSL